MVSSVLFPSSLNTYASLYAKSTFPLILSSVHCVDPLSPVSKLLPLANQWRNLSNSLNHKISGSVRLIKFIKLFEYSSSNSLIRAWTLVCSKALHPFFRNPRSDATGSPSLFLLIFHNSCQHVAVSSDDDRSFLFPRHNMLCFVRVSKSMQRPP